MESLKKVISLKQASSISGYHQDYLSFLIRRGEIKGQKIGRFWFTTEQEINKYLLKQKVRQNRHSVTDIFSTRSIKKIVLLGCLAVVAIFVFYSYFNTSSSENLVIQTVLTSSAEATTELKQ
jgi:hypothetical protein